jgi:large subunit ribosomal protein L31
VKQGIHPDYVETTVVCSCGNRFTTRSTAGGEMHVELCNQCHPFFTGQQKFVDTGGRVQRFSDKFGNAAAAPLEKEAAEKEARRKASEEAAIQAKQERDAKAAEKAAKAAQYEVKTARGAAKAEVVEDAPAAEAADDVAVEATDEAPAAEVVEAPVEESAE